MFIRRVEIENFRSHKSSKIDFDRGINLVVGRNGAGKTSILDAIAVALYGVKPLGMKKDDLIRDSANKYEIRLHFRLEGKDGVIVRSSDGNTYMKFDRLIEGDESVKRWVEYNIAPSHIWLNAIYVRQGEIEDIVRDDERREKIIKRITQIEDFEKAWDNLGKLIKNFEREVSRIEGEIRAEENIENKLKEARNELNLKKRELEEKIKELKDVEMELKEIDEEKKKLEEIKEKFNNLKRRREEIERSIEKIEERLKLLKNQKFKIEKDVEDLKRRVERLKEIEPKAMEYIRLKSEFEETIREEKRLREKLIKLKSEKENIEKKIEEINLKAESIQRLKRRKEEIEERIEEVESKASRYNDLKVKFDRLRELERKCRNIELIEREIEVVRKAKSKLKEIEKKLNDLIQNRAKIEKEAETLKDFLSALKSVKGICPTCRRPLSEEDRRDLIRGYMKKAENVNKVLNEIEEDLKRYEREKLELENVILKENEIMKELEMYEEIESLRMELKNFDEIENAWLEYNKLREEVSKISGEISALEKDLSIKKELEDRLKGIERRIEEVEEDMSRFKRIDEEILRDLERYYDEYNRLFNAKIELDVKIKDFEKCNDEIERCENEISNLREMLANIIKEIEELNYDEEVYRSCYKKYTEKLSKYSALKESINRLNDYIKMLESNVSDLENRFKRFEGKCKRLEKLRREVIPKLSELRERIRKYKVSLTEYAFKEVEKIASEIFEEMTEGKYSGIVLKREAGRKEKVAVKVIYQGVEKDISFLSGGELIALGLSFRLALSIFMIQGNIPLLILDEPTPFLDEERRRKLVDIMNRYLKKIPQVIVVTHDEELKDIADKVIRVDLHGNFSKVMIDEKIERFTLSGFS